jgi:hypothetical protein
MKYKIAVYWQEMGEIEVEADSLQEAINIARDDAMRPVDSEYIDFSYCVDSDCTCELNDLQLGSI